MSQREINTKMKEIKAALKEFGFKKGRKPLDDDYRYIVGGHYCLNVKLILKENNKVIEYGKGDPTERTHVARFIAHILSKLNELKPELPYCKVNQQMFDYLIKNRSGMLYPVNQMHGNAWIKAKITPNISVIVDNDLKYGAFTVGGFEIEKDREITVELTKDIN